MHNGQAFIVMERIRGNSLARVWNKLFQESKDKILAQLAKFIKELRSLSHPQEVGIANVDGGSLHDGRILVRSPRLGPFKATQEFHLFLRGGLTREPGYDIEVDHMMELQDRPWPHPVFTHGDLSSLTILVHGEEVIGIIDWETAGWYSPYWECTAACQVNPRNL
jgi:aminoglycoside phosphotransferase (APT) family kinase protein